MRKRLSVYISLWLSLSAVQLLSGQTLRVVDEQSQPLIGVHVMYGESATVTDDEGYCQITLEDRDRVQIQYLGYASTELSVAQLEALGHVVQLLPDDKTLEEIVIYGRTDAREMDLPYQVTRMKAEEIFSSNAQNSADALALNSGVYVQKSQLGGGSPVLRGFEANKVLLVVDGVRLNNAIYRNGHLQNAITIDPAILEQMEVIFGAGSLLYGSEALGGVIHFRTRNPLLDLSTTDKPGRHAINLHTRFATADQERTFHADHTYAQENWAVLTSVTSTTRDDLRAGSRRSEAFPDFGKRSWYVMDGAGEDLRVTNLDPDIQVGTGYNQLDLLQKWVWQPSTRLKAELNVQHSSSSFIPRYDNLIELRNGEPRFAEWSYGPQNRFLISPKLSWRAGNRLFDKTTLILSYQDVDESRYSRDFGSPWREVQIEDVKVGGVTLDFSKRLSPQQRLSYGVDLHHNVVNSSASLTQLQTREVAPTLTRYPNAGSTLTNLGSYVQHSWQNHDSTLVWVNGLRYTFQRTHLLYDFDGSFEWPDFFYEGIENKSDATVGISGLNLRRGPWLAKLSTGTSFRSPNVDDIAKIRVNGDEITIPNPELGPELVWNSELTLGYRSEDWSWEITGYHTRLRDAIIRAAGTLPDGSPTFLSRGDTLLVTTNVNAERGRVIGITTSARAQIMDKLTLDASMSVQSGRSEEEDGTIRPLGHIPPTYGHGRLRYQLGKFDLNTTFRFNAWKRIEDYGGSVDNPELGAVDADGRLVGTPSWSVWGLSASMRPTEQLTINVALENVLDVHYRPFASGVSGAGRHLVVALRYGL